MNSSRLFKIMMFAISLQSASQLLSLPISRSNASDKDEICWLNLKLKYKANAKDAKLLAQIQHYASIEKEAASLDYIHDTNNFPAEILVAKKRSLAQRVLELRNSKKAWVVGGTALAVTGAVYYNRAKIGEVVKNAVNSDTAKNIGNYLSTSKAGRLAAWGYSKMPSMPTFRKAAVATVGTAIVHDSVVNPESIPMVESEANVSGVSQLVAEQTAQKVSEVVPTPSVVTETPTVVVEGSAKEALKEVVAENASEVKSALPEATIYDRD